MGKEREKKKITSFLTLLQCIFGERNGGYSRKGVDQVQEDQLVSVACCRCH